MKAFIHSDLYSKYFNVVRQEAFVIIEDNKTAMEIAQATLWNHYCKYEDAPMHDELELLIWDTRLRCFLHDASKLFNRLTRNLPLQSIHQPN